MNSLSPASVAYVQNIRRKFPKDLSGINQQQAFLGVYNDLSTIVHGIRIQLASESGLIMNTQRKFQDYNSDAHFEIALSPAIPGVQNSIEIKYLFNLKQDSRIELQFDRDFIQEDAEMKKTMNNMLRSASFQRYFQFETFRNSYVFSFPPSQLCSRHLGEYLSFISSQFIPSLCSINNYIAAKLKAA